MATSLSDIMGGRSTSLADITGDTRGLDTRNAPDLDTPESPLDQRANDLRLERSFDEPARETPASRAFGLDARETNGGAPEQYLQRAGSPAMRAAVNYGLAEPGRMHVIDREPAAMLDDSIARNAARLNGGIGDIYGRGAFQARQADKIPEQKDADGARSIGQVAGDVWWTAAGVPSQFARGFYELADLATGGRLDEATGMSDKFRQTQKFFDDAHSQQWKDQHQKFEDAMEEGGVLNVLKAVVTNPTVAGDLLIQMAPYALGIGGAARGAESFVAGRMLARGASEKAAEKAGQVAAQASVVASNAGIGASSASSQAADQIANMSDAQIKKSPIVRQMLADGKSMAEARRAVTNRARAIAAGFSGIISGAAGIPAAGVEARFFTGKMAQSGGIIPFALGLTKTAGKETLEETLQEGGEQLSQNAGVKFSGADPNQRLGESVVENAAVGGLMGAAIGGSMHIIGHGAAQHKNKYQGRTAHGKAKTQADNALFKLYHRETMSEADYDALKAAGYARDNTGDFPQPIEMTDRGTARFNALRGFTEQTGDSPDATAQDTGNQPQQSTEVDHEQAAGTGPDIGRNPKRGEPDQRQGEEAQAAQHGHGRGRPGRVGAEPARSREQQSPVTGESEAPDSAGAFDPAAALADSLARSKLGGRNAQKVRGDTRRSDQAGQDTQGRRKTGGKGLQRDTQEGRAEGRGQEGQAQVAAWQTPRSAFYRDPNHAGVNHKQAVSDALDRGERVPPDVMVDYPDLVAAHPAPVDSAARDAAESPDNDTPAPSEAQKKAGNYKQAHIKLSGLDIAIENPVGSTRKGKDADGKSWRQKMSAHYGRIKRTESADGENVDVFVKPGTRDVDTAYVIDQHKPDGSFDEPKVILGSESMDDARATYRAHYPDDWTGDQTITAMPLDQFKDWLKNGDMQRPAAPASNKVASVPIMITRKMRGQLADAGYSEADIRRMTPQQAHDALSDNPYASQSRIAPAVATGDQRTVTTSRGDKVAVEGAFVDADDLIASQTAAGNTNPNFPAHLQPRDRARMSSQAQVDHIARNLDPELLDDTAKASDGAPVIGDDNVVESGNGRVTAIRKAYANGNAQTYRDFVARKAAKAGVDISGMARPVYVRRRVTPLDDAQRAEFTRAANQSDLSAFSPAEQARSDAARITDNDLAYFDPGADGNVLAASNDAFLRRFADRIGADESGTLRTADGRWNKRMADRVQAAVFAKAYGDDRLLTLATEEADPDVRNVLAGLQAAAPEFARARDADGSLGDLDTAAVLVDAVDKVRESRHRGQDLTELLSQEDAFTATDPEVADVARMIDANIRSGKRLGAYFSEIGRLTEKYATEGADSLFGDRVSRSDILESAKREYEARHDRTPIESRSQAPANPARDIPADAQESAGESEHTRRGRAAAENAAPPRSLKRADRERRKQNQPGQAPGFALAAQQAERPAEPADESPRLDLLGDDTRNAQAIADETRRRDTRRSPGTDVPADIDGGLFANTSTELFDTGNNRQAAQPAATANGPVTIADVDRAQAAIEQRIRDAANTMSAKEIRKRAKEPIHNIGGSVPLRKSDALNQAVETVPINAQVAADAFGVALSEAEQRVLNADVQGKVIEAQSDADNSADNTGQPDKARVDDLGDKIGGARKDTAEKTGPRRRPASQEQDERPAWARRYVALEKVGAPGKWMLGDTGKKNALGGAVRPAVRTVFDSEQAALDAIPLVAVARNHSIYSAKGDPDKFAIWRQVTDRKRVQVSPAFETRDEAKRYMATHAVQIIETKTSFGEELLAKPDQVVRTGKTHRQGDVTGDDFMAAFGFRGVEFGNWNNQDERQDVMNHAYDGLMDLADILGVPPKALSLNGDLALAFGARGHGLSSARAHYERNYAVINLTKLSGAGSLAHEWFHALDHYFARQDGKASSDKVTNQRGDSVFKIKKKWQDYLSHGAGVKTNLRDALRAAYDNLMTTILRRGEDYIVDTARTEQFVGRAHDRLNDLLGRIRSDLAEANPYRKRHNQPASADQLAEFDRLAQRLLDGVDLATELRPNDTAQSKGRPSYRMSNDTLDAISAILKTVRGHRGFGNAVASRSKKGLLDSLASDMTAYQRKLKLLEEARTADVKTRTVPSQFATEARQIDKGRGADYWSTPHEMAARAFSAYVEDKTAGLGQISNFLSYGSDNTLPEYRIFDVRPFPEGDERTAINAAFDHFADTLKTRDTDQGVALFSRGNRMRRTAPQTPASSQDRTDVETLSNVLAQYLRRDAVPMRAVGAVSSDSARAARSLAGLFGKRAVFYDTADPIAGGFNGITLPSEPEVVYLNARSPVSHTALMGHELTHQLKNDRPDLWAPLHDAARQAMVNDAEYADWLNARMAEEGAAPDTDLIHEEMIADYIGDQFMKPAFWADVMDRAESPEVRAGIAAQLRAFIDRILGWLKQHGFQSSRFFRDTQNLRAAAADAFAGYADSQDVPTNAAGVRASRAQNEPRRAPNGQPSNLNARQHAQVRTPEFKTWFGDWEAIAHQRFFDGPPVATLTGDEFVSDGVPLTEKVPKWYAEHGNETVPVDGIGPVTLDEQAVQNSLSHGIGRDKASAFAAVPAVLRQGRIIHSEPMRGARDAGMIYHVAAPIDMGDEPFIADVVVKADTNSKRMYVHEVALKKKLQQSVFKTGADAAEAGVRAGTDAGAILSVLQRIYAVNPADVSKIVDENGEPLVVYHGTDADIEAFDPMRSRYDKGIYVTPRADYASGYADAFGAKSHDSNVMKLFVHMKNPAYMLVKPMDDDSGAGLQQSQIDDYIAQGHDGLVVGLTEYEHRTGAQTIADKASELVIFDPTQLKSAIGNRGTYDPANPDIRASRASDTENDNPATSLLDRGRRRLWNRPPRDTSDPFFAENQRLRDADRTLWDRAGKILRRQLSPRGLLPANVFDAKIARDNEFKVVEVDVNNAVGHFEHAVKADYGKRFTKLSAADRALLSEGLAGQLSAAIPKKTRTALAAMRRYIDRLSTEYMSVLDHHMDRVLAPVAEQIGVRPDELRTFITMAEPEEAMDDAQNALFHAFIAQGMSPDVAAERAYSRDNANPMMTAVAKAATLNTIRGNVGRYVHRSYRAFDDPKWNTKISDDVANAARSVIYQRYLEQGETEAEAGRLTEVILNEIVKNGTAYDNLESFITESKLGAKDLSVLKHRQQISPEIRALLGEYDDPRINFAKSASKMGRLVWNDRFLTTVREQGMGTIFFEGTDRPPGATAQLATEGSKTLEPLSGLWTYPEVKQGFVDALDPPALDTWYKKWVQLNGATKYGKTVLAPATAMRNFQSALFFSLANGHFDMRDLRTSIAVLREYFTNNGSGARVAYLRKMKALGVIYDTPYAGEMMQLLADASTEDNLLRDTNNLTLKKALDFAQKFYSYGDDFWKILGFENEKRMLMKRAGLDEAEAEAKAAERIRNTYPTYSMVPRAIQQLRRFPLVGTFVAFPAEIIRTTGNMVRYVAADLADPKMRSIGLQRLAGMAMVGGMFAGLQALSKAWFDIDDDDEEAVRNLAAPWSKNSNLMFIGRDDKGRLQYFDMSYIDPYNYFKRPFVAMSRDQSWHDAFVSSARDMLEPFFGWDITSEALISLATNHKPESGQPIYDEHAPALDQIKQASTWLADDLQPGVTGNLMRTWKAVEGQHKPSGQAYVLKDEMLAWAGWRKTTLDPKVSMYYRAFEFNDQLSAAQKGLYRLMRDPDAVSDARLQSAYAATLSQRAQAFDAMHEIVASARTSGLSDADIAQILSSSSVSKANIAALLSGDVPAWQPTSSAMRYGMRKAIAVYDDAEARQIRDRFARIQQMSLAPEQGADR